MEQYLRLPGFDRLGGAEKRPLMEAVAARTGFAFKRLETFRRWVSSPAPPTAGQRRSRAG